MEGASRDVEMSEASYQEEGPFGLSKNEWMYYQFVQKHAKGVRLKDRPQEMDVEEAYLAMNALLKKNTIEIVQLNGESLLRAIDLGEAQNASKLNDEERLVYNTIRTSGNSGLWTKDLKKKTNLPTMNINRVLKKLEQTQMIKAVKHVKYPTRKIYMLYNLTPSSDVTGGAWYTDQELDTDFIDSLKAACYKYISARSFPPKDKYERDAVYDAEYEHYPNAIEVRRFITESRISSIDLSVKDITSLLDVLVFDGEVEKKQPYVGMGDFSDDEDDDGSVPWTYKAVRKVHSRLPNEALTEAPCGKCPVFSFCKDDGPVSPWNCEYFKDWLAW